MNCSMPAALASSTAYWISGRSTIGSISFGMALVAGRKRAPRPPTGKMALRTGLNVMRDPSLTEVTFCHRGAVLDNRGRRRTDNCPSGPRGPSIPQKHVASFVEAGRKVIRAPVIRVELQHQAVMGFADLSL